MLKCVFDKNYQTFIVSRLIIQFKKKEEDEKYPGMFITFLVALIWYFEILRRHCGFWERKCFGNYFTSPTITKNDYNFGISWFVGLFRLTRRTTFSFKENLESTKRGGQFKFSIFFFKLSRLPWILFKSKKWRFS